MKKLLLIATIIMSVKIWAQDKTKITPEEYINIYKDIAISEMKRNKIPASITLAQGILESEFGNSILSKKSNNHFGIKCKADWVGPKTYADDDAKGECFRVYSSTTESYKDHSDFLKINPRYNFLFDLDITDYKGWCYGLKKAGYATNPKYPELLISTIEKYNLQNYNSGNGIVINQNAEMNLEINNTKKVETKNTIVKNTPTVIEKVSLYDKKLIQGRQSVFITKGISILAVAEKMNMKISKILKYNTGLADGLLKEDTWIFIEK